MFQSGHQKQRTNADNVELKSSLEQLLLDLRCDAVETNVASREHGVPLVHGHGHIGLAVRSVDQIFGRTLEDRMVEQKCNNRLCRIESTNTVSEEEVATATNFPNIPRTSGRADASKESQRPLICAKSAVRGSHLTLPFRVSRRPVSIMQLVKVARRRHELGGCLQTIASSRHTISILLQTRFPRWQHSLVPSSERAGSSASPVRFSHSLLRYG